MTKTIQELRKEYEALQKLKAEKEEREKLESSIKEMQEAGTLKGKAKTVLKAAREHLHKKGQEFKQTGKRQQNNGFGSNIIAMSRESNFGTPKEITEANYQSPLYKELTQEKKKKKKKEVTI